MSFTSSVILQNVFDRNEKLVLNIPHAGSSMMMQFTNRTK